MVWSLVLVAEGVSATGAINGWPIMAKAAVRWKRKILNRSQCLYVLYCIWYKDNTNEVAIKRCNNKNSKSQ